MKTAYLAAKTAQPPVLRRLRGFAFDPSVSAQAIGATMNDMVYALPWEDLQPGPVGEYLEIIDYDPPSQMAYEPVDLNDPYLLAQDGIAPSAENPKFHQQMIYAVAMTTLKNFERALGRSAVWAPHFDKGKDVWVPRLRIYPHALREANAYYSPEKKALLFGYFPADDAPDLYPHGMVFTCLSHDIIAHEMTHALLDGMHPRFIEDTHPDALAFHEAFADIVALFQHFTFPEVLAHQIARTRGDLETESLLGQLAQEFGRATGGRGSLRSAIGEMVDGKWQRLQPDPTALDRVTEPHDRGSILVAAVFDAFLKIYHSRIADLKRIASHGTGILPAGDLHPDLVKRFASEASKTARHLLNICIRALDYCPPVDITFGDYLRAMITADRDLVPDDPHGYRTAIIESFRARGIYPHGMRSLSEESLTWDRIDDAEARKDLAVKRLLEEVCAFFSEFRFYGSREETWQATRKVKREIHRILTEKVAFPDEFEVVTGLALRKASALPGAVISPTTKQPAVQVHSLWPIQRARVDGTLMNQVVGSIIQTCEVKDKSGNVVSTFRGGCTIVFDLDTQKLRYAIRKPINVHNGDGQRRRDRQDAYRAGNAENMGLRNTYFGALSDSLHMHEPLAALHGDHF